MFCKYIFEFKYLQLNKIIIILMNYSDLILDEKIKLSIAWNASS